MSAEEASMEASAQQLPPATAQQMAACLATPFTGTDKNMGEILRSEVDRLNAEQELKTQLRCALLGATLICPPTRLSCH